MILRLDIPESVLRMLEAQGCSAEAELRKDLALGFYTRRLVSAGKAAEIAGISRLQFEALLGERQIPFAYDDEDLEKDLARIAEYQTGTPL